MKCILPRRLVPSRRVVGARDDAHALARHLVEEVGRAAHAEQLEPEEHACQHT